MRTSSVNWLGSLVQLPPPNLNCFIIVFSQKQEISLVLKSRMPSPRFFLKVVWGLRLKSHSCHYPLLIKSFRTESIYFPDKDGLHRLPNFTSSWRRFCIYFFSGAKDTIALMKILLRSIGKNLLVSSYKQTI